MVRNGNRGCFWLRLLENNELREKEVCRRGGEENEAWKGFRRRFRSGIIEMWKGGMLPSPPCKHCLIKFSSLKLVDMKHSRKEQPSSECPCSSLAVTSGLAQWGQILESCCTQCPWDC